MFIHNLNPTISEVYHNCPFPPLINNYKKALQTLEKIINNEDLVFNEKSIAEELMAYTKQKMGI